MNVTTNTSVGTSRRGVYSSTSCWFVRSGFTRENLTSHVWGCSKWA